MTRRPIALLATLTCCAAISLARPLGTLAQADGTPGGATADAYLAGERLREAGDWRGALEVWEAAWDSMSFVGEYDPRIGIAFVETATRHGLESVYERASELYLWGLATADVGAWGDVLADEVARIGPLLPAAERGRLASLLAARDPQLTYELKRFWIEADPTPTTAHNERVIEHWERIAVARERYVSGRYTPYGTDDRGLYYVRYGRPDKHEAGMLGSRENELQFWISDHEARRRIRQYDKNPAFEVWVYEGLNDDELVYLLFGQEDGTGRLELVDGPGDLVPPEAFSASTRRYTPGGIKAGFFLEFFYYSDLASIGGPYGQRFAELDLAWGNAEKRALRGGISTAVAPPPESRLEAYKDRFDQEDRHTKTWVPEVPSRSDYDRTPDPFNLHTWGFRSLAGGDEPRLTIVALAAPRVALGRVRHLERGLNEGGRAPPIHTLIVRDGRMEEIGRTTSLASSQSGDIGIFMLRHVDQRLHYTVVTGDPRDGGGGGGGGERSVGRSYLHGLEPLDPDPARLEMSDLMTGVRPWDGIDAGVLPFPVVPSRRIWQGEALRVFFEVYHLRPAEDGVHGVTVDFLVRAIDVDQGPAPEPVTLTVDLESATPTRRGDFDLVTRDLPPGLYRLAVTAQARESRQEVTRTSDFEIIGR